MRLALPLALDTRYHLAFNVTLWIIIRGGMTVKSTILNSKFKPTCSASSKECSAMMSFSSEGLPPGVVARLPFCAWYAQWTRHCVDQDRSH